MRISARPSVWLAAALATVAFVSVDAAAVAQPGDAADAHRVAASWNAQRRAAAKPRDVVLAAPVEKAKGSGGGTTGGGVTGASWPDASTDPVERSVAKVFFTLGGLDYVCSASVVEPSADTPGRSVVLTAGHCTWDDRYGYATEFLIVPNYDAFVGDTCSLDVNCWVAESLHASTGWRAAGSDYAHDFAFVAFNGSLATTVGPDATVPVALGLAPPTAVHAFGYPAAKKYSGHDLVYCAGATVRGPGSYSANVGLACDQTGGSSGGPWYAEFNGARVAVSLNSFGLRGYTGYMFGPVFDAQATAALNAASG